MKTAAMVWALCCLNVVDKLPNRDHQILSSLGESNVSGQLCSVHSRQGIGQSFEFNLVGKIATDACCTAAELIRSLFEIEDMQFSGIHALNASLPFYQKDFITLQPFSPGVFRSLFGVEITANPTTNNTNKSANDDRPWLTHIIIAAIVLAGLAVLIAWWIEDRKQDAEIERRRERCLNLMRSITNMLESYTQPVGVSNENDKEEDKHESNLGANR
jgi:hypothetical protein